ncbi:DNA ligase [Sulfobacillus harzensis]|uniref:DNA ligase n=1 Tax=Sulfobacillus harzensis TaxID=2729629 RepID=A0A7Y0L348_9FIRM|nr:DNA ligase [Sulfobacillus harzensis]NMP22439.1 DNA ligase [Sulfobacillus harzensis]
MRGKNMAPANLSPGDFVPPMLAVTADRPFSRAGWWFETKWDGYRAIISHGRTFHVYSRRGHDLMRWYPVLRQAAPYVPQDTVLDAELVAWEDGQPNFSALQQRRAGHYLLMVFDCLYAHGRWLMHEPFKTRLEILHQVVATRGMIVVSEGVAERGEDYFRAIEDMNLEGVMAKRLDGAYLPGRRSPSWQKFLALKSAWFWVTGVQQSDHEHWLWHLAREQEGRLVAAGRVSAPAGWTASMETGAGRLSSPLAVEVAYREITHEGHLRHARVRQWRQGSVAQSLPPIPDSLS